MRRLTYSSALPILFLLLALLLGAVVPARGVGFGILREVTTLQDRVNPNDGVLSLREAIAQSATGDGIAFAVTGTITLELGELRVERGISIQGPGARKLKIDGNNASRVLMIATREQVYISGLTLTRGHIVGGSGGSEQQWPSGDGGGVYNFASLTMSECAITNCVARGVSGPQRQVGGQGEGGGIFNDGILLMRNCTVSGNRAQGGAGSEIQGNVAGGGIYNELGAQLQLVNTTITDNTALSRVSSGGGVFSRSPTRLVSTTISGNRALGEISRGGGVYLHNTNLLFLHHTLIAGNTSEFEGQDILSFPVSEGYNLIGIREGSMVPGGQPYTWEATDQTGTAEFPLDPRLGPLRNNGGPTDTMALRPASTAQNAGGETVLGPDGTTPLTTDQRGLPRRIRAQVDIGAYERDIAQTGPNFVVNTLDDSEDDVPGINHCSLRTALKVANQADDVNNISFKAGLSGVIEVGFPLYVLEPVTIIGPGPRVLAVSGGGKTTVFDISSDSATIARLTIRDGQPAVAGGGIGGGPPHSFGGGIMNRGRLVLRFCALVNNQARGGRVGAGRAGDAMGGAIYNSGVLILGNCTLALNSAWGGEGAAGQETYGGYANGGAILNEGSATLTNCTLYNNAVLGGSGGSPNGGGASGNGGAIFNFGALSLLNCSLVRNTAWGGFNGANQEQISQGGGLCHFNRTSTVRNTLFARNRATNGPDVYGHCNTDGTNLVERTDGFSSWLPTDRTGTTAAPLDAVLGVFANHGGETDTVALLAGSPAINGASATTAPARDQRDFLRVGAPDIGAFEFGGQPLLPPVNISVFPSSLTSLPGRTRTVTAVYNDPNGAADLASVSLLVNSGPAGGSALYVHYDALANRLYLRNHANSAWLGGYAPGVSAVISDAAGKGSLNCAGTRVSRNGESLTVAWSLTPNESLTGNRKVYLFSRDRTGRTRGWDLRGSWSVAGPPVNAALSPVSSSGRAGAARTLSASYRDPNGAADIREAYILVNASTARGKALYAFYNAAENLLYLRDDANRAWLGGCAPGSPNSIRDPAGQGSLDCAGTKVARSGNTLTVHWRFTPASTFTGTKNVYLLVKDSLSLRDGWEPMGTWAIGP